MFDITLGNYRSFKNQKITFSKINILIGENSSGKSSVLKFLMALKQTLHPSINQDINLALSGNLVDLGTYKDVIYYQQDDLPLSFTFSFDKEYTDFYFDFFIEIEMLADKISERNKINEILNISTKSYTEVTYNLTKELNKHESIKTQITNSSLGELKITYPKIKKQKKQNILYNPKCTISYLDFKDKIVYEINNIDYSKTGFSTLIQGDSLRQQLLVLIEQKYSLIENYQMDDESIQAEVNTLYYRIAFLLVSQNYIHYLLDSINYINPIDALPSRVYLNSDEKKSLSIKNLQDFVDFFSRQGKATQLILKDLNLILKNIGIAEEIEIVKDTRLPVRELKVKIKDLISNVLDVGYGVSLLLPLLLNALISERLRKGGTSIVLIEQPEVHLHPKLQAALIDTLISLSKNTIYIIETHSEHFVRKIQVLVKEEKYGIKPKDISIHYFRRIEKKSEISVHEVDFNGLLEPDFPTGFFDNTYLLVKQLLQ